MLDIVRQVDMFGTQFQFSIFKNSKFKTKTGGCTTIFCIILVFVSFFIFGKDFLFKKNPRVLSQIVIPDEYPEPFRITPENFVIPWRLSDSFSNSVNMTNLFYPIITYYKYEFNTSGQFMTLAQEIPMTKCDKKIANIPELKNNYKLDDYYCINSTEHNLTFGGSWDGTYINYIDILLYFCPNGNKFSPDANCTDLETVKDYLGKKINTYFEIIYPEYYFSPDDLINPLKKKYKMYYTNLDLSMQKIDRLYFKKIELEDDRAWIFDDFNYENLYGASEIKFDYSLFNESSYGVSGVNSFFYSMNFYYQKNFDKIHRSYMKFQEIASIMGGIIKIVTLFGTIFIFFINQIYKDENIFNEFFIYKNEFNHSVPNSSPIVHMLKLNPMNVNINYSINNSSHALNNINKLNNKFNFKSDEKVSNIKNNSLSNQNKFKKSNEISLKSIQGDLNIIKEENNILNHIIIKNKTNSKENTIKFGFCFNLSKYFCIRSNSYKDRLYNFLKNYFDDRLDLIYYLKTIQTVEKMKLLLFNNPQSLCFDFLKTPNLKNEEELENLENENIKSNEKKLNEIIEYFSQKYKRKEIDDTDEKLLNMIRTDIKQMSFMT